MKAIITPTKNGFNEPIWLIGVATDTGEVLFERFLLRPALSDSTAYRWRSELQKELDKNLFLFSKKQREILKEKGIAL